MSNETTPQTETTGTPPVDNPTVVIDRDLAAGNTIEGDADALPKDGENYADQPDANDEYSGNYPWRERGA